MDNILVWLLIFAGAAIALLGLFLAASERELRNKRLQVELLSNKIGDIPTASVATTPPTAMTNDFENAAVLRLVNEELQTEVTNLSAKVDASRKAIRELEAAAQRDRDSQAELQHLRKANEALISELVDLKARLDTGPGQVQEAVTQRADFDERERQLHNEIADMQHQLAEQQQKLRDVQETQEKLANVEFLVTLGADERRQLESKVAELEHELETVRQGTGEADELRATLGDLERQREALREENRKYEQEIRRWQQRSAEADENRERLSELCGPLDALIAKHTELAVRHSQLEKDLATFAGLLAVRRSAPRDHTILHDAVPDVTEMLPADNTAFTRPTMNPAVKGTDNDRDQSSVAGVPGHQLTLSNDRDTGKKRRVGVASLVVIVAVAAALAYGVLNSASEEAENSKLVVASVTPVEPSPKHSEDSTPMRLEEETPVQSASLSKNPAPMKKKETALREKMLPATKSDLRVYGVYEVTQTSRVYAAPTESSQLLGDVEPGVKVNVVNAQDGWLEIHSKHGRPPGFIRKEAARAAKN